MKSIKKFKNKNSKVICILLIVFLFGWIIAKIYNAQIDQHFVNNQFRTIGKVYDVKYGAKNISIKYKYVYQSKLYWSHKPISNDRFDKSLIGNFFEVILSTENPNLSKLILNKQINNKEKIINSGL